ncbi:hypothetical protein DY000_02014849 [Brassica cretica]|uniref:Uncharacterized protein n=1 Tax=Brassica cretica TaxID=69181 RepID=A0ABQ7D0Q1_BRACR|nr:hypothetical protein DY000_02014849 [Brassica cretica]
MKVRRKTESRSKLQKPRKRIAETDHPASSTMTRASSPGEHDRVAGRLAGKIGRDTSQLARRARPCCRSTRRRARPRHKPACPASTTVLPVDSPASSAVTRASSPGEHDRVAGRLAGELDRGTDQLARRAPPILRGPFQTRSHPITMHLRPKFP